MKLADVFADAEVARLYRYRAPYPDGVIDMLRRLMVGPRVVLDAGAGSGAIARRLVPFADRVDAVDPSAAMIEAGRSLPGGDDPRIRWVVAPAEDVELTGPYGLITCGASLHWMDPGVVLPRFRDALAPGAVVAVVDTETSHGAYRDELVEVIKEHSEVEDHRETSDLIDELRRSGRFAVHGEERTSPVRVEPSVDDYIEFLHSTSTLARIRLGARSVGFDEQVRAVFARRGLEKIAFDIVGYVASGSPR